MKILTKRDVLKFKKLYKELIYAQKVEKYVALNNNTNYRCLNEDEFEQVFGYRFNQIRGYDEFDDKSKEFIGNGILRLSNGCGIDYKADMLVYKVEYYTRSKRVKLYHCDGYSWLYMNGTIG